MRIGAGRERVFGLDRGEGFRFRASRAVSAVRPEGLRAVPAVPLALRPGGPVAVLLAVSFFLLPPPVAAQEEPAARGEGLLPVLTLEEALERAERHNPELRNARRELEYAAPARREALGAFLPSLSLSARTGGSFSRVTRVEDFFGTPIENPEVETRVNSSTSQSVSLGVTLLEGGSRFHRVDRVRAENRARHRAAELHRVRTGAEVERRFYELQRRVDLLAVEEELLEARRRDLEVTRRMFALAGASRADVLGTELEVARQEEAVAEARSGVEESRLTLRTAVGDPSLGEFRPAPAPVEAFDPSELEAGALLAAVREASPELASREAEVASRRAGLSALRAQRWPEVSLSASAGRTAFGPEGSALLDPSSDQLSGVLGLHVSLPVFHQFSDHARVVRARIDARNAEEDLRALGDEVDARIRTGLLELRNAHRSVELAERAREVAGERLRIAREEYRLAARSFEELQAAARDAAEARRRALEARYAFVQARIDLEETLGKPLEAVLEGTSEDGGAPLPFGTGTGTDPSPGAGDGDGPGSGVGASERDPGSPDPT